MSRRGPYDWLWPHFYEKENFHPQDPRLQLVELLYNFFISPDANYLIKKIEFAYSGNVYIDVQRIAKVIPFPDFNHVLTTRPNDVTNTMGMALSRLANEKCPYLETPIIKHPRFYNLDHFISFGEVKSNAVGHLVALRGHVVRVSPCKALLTKGYFRCPKCRHDTLEIFEDGVFTTPDICSATSCKNKYLEFNRQTVETTDYQRIKLTESDSFSEHVTEESNSRIPRTVDIEVRQSLVNTCIVGDVITVVGVVKAMQMELSNSAKWGGGGGKKGTRESGLHQLYILANTIICTKSSNDRLTIPKSKQINTAPEDEEDESGLESLILDGEHAQVSHAFSGTPLDAFRFTKFKPPELAFIAKLARMDEWCLPILLQNFCPIIFGHELVKLGLLLALFGGTNMAIKNPQLMKSNWRVRSNIHVLVVGDPGLGKSQMLRAATNMAPRGIFVCGNTSTTAGLTVTIAGNSGSRYSNDTCIEAGALVLADQGICSIDELDKMTSTDQQSLLETMEQQSISIAKSGMVTSLRARCGILAAANPVQGHYNKRRTVGENLKMSSALLSRFDLIYILVDRPDETQDQLISEHILGTTNKNFEPTKKRAFGVMMEDSTSSLSTHLPAWDSEELKELSLAQRLRRQVQYVKQMQRKFGSSTKKAIAESTVSINNETASENRSTANKDDEMFFSGSSNLDDPLHNQRFPEKQMNTTVEEETEDDVLARLWGSTPASINTTAKSNNRSGNISASTSNTRENYSMNTTQPPSTQLTQSFPYSTPRFLSPQTPQNSFKTTSDEVNTTTTRYIPLSHAESNDITLQTTVKKPPLPPQPASTAFADKKNMTTTLLNNSRFFDLLDDVEDETIVTSSSAFLSRPRQISTISSTTNVSTSSAMSHPSMIFTHSSASASSTPISPPMRFPTTTSASKVISNATAAKQSTEPAPPALSFSSQSIPKHSTLSSSSSQTSRGVDKHFDESDTNDLWQLSSDQIKRYIEYAKVYCHPMLTKEAAKVLQRHYLLLRAQSTSGNSLPITTRNLESLIRLAQARARVELREQVTAADAEEVVQLLQESLLDIYTDEHGIIDVTRRGGTSMNKQMKALVTMMNKEVTQKKQGNNLFTKQEIVDIVHRLQLNKEVDELIENMRRECYLLLKGPKLYQLQTME